MIMFMTSGGDLRARCITKPIPLQFERARMTHRPGAASPRSPPHKDVFSSARLMTHRCKRHCCCGVGDQQSPASCRDSSMS